MVFDPAYSRPAERQIESQLLPYKLGYNTSANSGLRKRRIRKIVRCAVAGRITKSEILLEMRAPYQHSFLYRDEKFALQLPHRQ